MMSARPYKSAAPKKSNVVQFNYFFQRYQRGAEFMLMRRQRGMTLNEVATILRCSDADINAYESGKSNYDDPTVVGRIACLHLKWQRQNL